jgi:hypothetical protein
VIRRGGLYRGGRIAAYFGAALGTFWLFDLIYSLRFLLPKHSVSGYDLKPTE